MSKDTSNIFTLPVKEDGQAPLQIARALVDYISERKNAKVIAIVMDDDDSSITMGWSKMDSATLALMLNFAKYKWERTVFEETD